jgi:ferric-dicitrate binding protein FerR (iron transport regulator)
MPESSPLTEQEHADLVAYLDGELEGEAARAMAARISLDPQVRAEADALSRAWEMLEYLPKAEPSPTFTHRTVERISALGPARPGRHRTWALALGWAASLLLAAAGGFLGINQFYPADHTDEELARDLPVIENRRLYEPIDDIDFVWGLNRPDLFGDENPGN